MGTISRTHCILRSRFSVKTSQTSKIAFGGIICALSLVTMFLSSVFPMAEYTCPALAGIFLIALVIDFNKKTALIAYIAISLLSIFMLPNKESAILFVAFLGYYPILKSRLEQTKSRVVEWIFKIGIFNIAVVVAYVIIIYVFQMTELLSDMQAFAKYGVYILLALGNVAFVVYDFALTNLIAMYIQRIKPKFKHMF